MIPRYRFIVRFYSTRKPTFHNANANANVVRSTNGPSKGRHRGKSLILVGTLALVTSVISINYQKTKPIEYLE
ncbi:hypothetical protein N7582_003506 [Saccharomyces uvarum]|uniref:Uncharacterized protein n=1 Tax=Saccharomyces uvarum TaxID=230603 RepID=A0AA35J2C7_SACUV|nr:hypothetical protein N7582_003506 [Saccharomyces uvarum]CAI4045376.1 hypothetical protein SUVC_11G1910 [Saccharomyces uvarum]